MGFLARRDHSEKELRQKLLRNYDETDVELAIHHCREHGWLAKPEALSEQTMNALHRRKKGFLLIQRYLRQKGLPVPKCDEETEIEKARQLLARKWPQGLTGDAKNSDLLRRAYRHLKSRGFQEEIIRKVLYVHDRS